MEDPRGRTELPAIRLRPSKLDARQVWRSIRLSRSLRTAALLLAGFALGTLASHTRQSETPSAAPEFATGPDGRVTVTLGDGTFVHLAPDSRLRLRDDGERVVELDGHAFFAVAPKDGERFKVVTEAGKAEVLGTRFDLRVRDGELQLLVVEGRVEVAGPEGRAEVRAGELSRKRPGEAPIVERVEDVESYLAWMGQTLIFQDTPLPDVIRTIERRYAVPVELGDPELASRTVTAWLSGMDFVDAVTAVCRVIGARCTVSASKAWIGVGEAQRGEPQRERSGTHDQ